MFQIKHFISHVIARAEFISFNNLYLILRALMTDKSKIQPVSPIERYRRCFLK